MVVCRSRTSWSARGPGVGSDGSQRRSTRIAGHTTIPVCGNRALNRARLIARPVSAEARSVARHCSVSHFAVAVQMSGQLPSSSFLPTTSVKPSTSKQAVEIPRLVFGGTTRPVRHRLRSQHQWLPFDGRQYRGHRDGRIYQPKSWATMGAVSPIRCAPPRGCRRSSLPRGRYSS